MKRILCSDWLSCSLGFVLFVPAKVKQACSVKDGWILALGRRHNRLWLLASGFVVVVVVFCFFCCFFFFSVFKDFDVVSVHENAKKNLTSIPLYYMAGSASGQDEANPVF